MAWMAVIENSESIAKKLEEIAPRTEQEEGRLKPDIQVVGKCMFVRACKICCTSSLSAWNDSCCTELRHLKCVHRSDVLSM